MFGYWHGDLKRFNRPVRTRMPGGVGGARSLRPPPIPIQGVAWLRLDYHASSPLLRLPAITPLWHAWACYRDAPMWLLVHKVA